MAGSESWITKTFVIHYKTETGSGMVRVKARDEHQARHEFVSKHGMRYGTIQKIEEVGK